MQYRIHHLACIHSAAVQCNTIYITFHYITEHGIKSRCIDMNATHYTSYYIIALHCRTMQHSMDYMPLHHISLHSIARQDIAMQCTFHLITLHRIAVHCNTLQDVYNTCTLTARYTALQEHNATHMHYICFPLQYVSLHNIALQ